MNTVQSKAAFLKWAKANFPAIYRRGAGLGALTIVATPADKAAEKSAIENAFDAVSKFLSDPKFIAGAAGAYQSKQLIDINIQRAKQGLPPLENAVNPQVNFGLSNNVQLILWGGLGITALYLFTRKRG